MATPVCPVGTYTERSPRSRAALSSSSVTTFFPITVSEPTLCTTRTESGRCAGPCGTVRSGGGAQVAQLRAGLLGRAAQLRIVRELGVQAGLERESGIHGLQQHRPPGGIELAAGGATPISRLSAPRSIASSSVATIGVG